MSDDFIFSPHNLKGREKILQRFFEILPGAASWTILLGIVFMTFWKPILAAILIIAFDFYWLLRLFYATLFLVLAYLRLSFESDTDWMKRVHGLDDLDHYSRELAGVSAGFSPGKWFSLMVHKKELRLLKETGASQPLSKDIYHLVIVPVLMEPREILEPGIRGLTQGSFPSSQVLVVLAVEDRARDQVKRGTEEIREKYASSFLDFLLTFHPDGISGEARVKGSNVSYAARQAAGYFQDKGIPFDNVIVSCFDADTVVSPDYLACLTYRFMSCPDRQQSSFQPIPVYHNNIWEATGFARVLEMGSSFFQLVESTNPDTLVTFSSHSMSFKALVDAGYWPVDMISDDSAIFWKCFIHFHGNYHVVPMYTTISMDVVTAKNWFKTVQNVYRQKRRWAWGVENFPIVIRGFLQSGQISLYDKIRHGFKLFEGHVAWATWAILLTVIGWLPALYAGREFSDTVVYYSAPRITAIIFNLATLALLTTLVLSQCLLPRRKVRHLFFKRIVLALEWFFVPLIVTFLSALPALEAQTRLMLGKYMEFWVTDKQRKHKR